MRGVRKIRSSVFVDVRVGRLEQVAEDRQVAQQRDLGDVVVDRLLVDAADHRRVAVVDVICVMTFLVSIDGTVKPPPSLRTNWPTRILVNLDRHDDPVVGRDLRRHVEPQHRLLELHGRGG